MNIKAERARKGLTQSDLAELIGVTTVTIQKYEENPRRAPGEKLVALAEVFDCTTDYLLGLTEERK